MAKGKENHDLQAIYRASRRCALDMCKDIKSKNRKKLIADNTRFVYNDCKTNPNVRAYVLEKYGKK